jgi:preprotein translocase subunit SecF
MKPLVLFRSGTNFNFIGRRRLFFALSALLMLASIGAYIDHGLNFGIDFKGGILIEIKTDGPADMAQLRDAMSGLGVGEVSLQEFGSPDDVLIRIEAQEGGEGANDAAIQTLRDALGDSVEYRRVESVGPKVGDELKEAGIYAVLSALVAILLYIWFRFEWQFGVGAVVALAHDVIATIGVFSVLGMEFTLATVAAVLTIAGYSINDTVVVFDRVRENMRKYKKMDLPELLNRSVNETLSRTVVTSVTTLLALVALYVFGGQIIRDFSFAMIWGVLVGTYSSIFVAAPTLIYLRVRGGIFGGDEEGKNAAPMDQDQDAATP